MLKKKQNKTKSGEIKKIKTADLYLHGNRFYGFNHSRLHRCVSNNITDLTDKLNLGNF